MMKLVVANLVISSHVVLGAHYLDNESCRSSGPNTFTDGIGGEAEVIKITGQDRIDWFKNLFTPYDPVKLGTGKDVSGSRTPYDALTVRGVYRIVSTNDQKRFREHQDDTYRNGALKKYTEFLQQRPHKISNGTAEQQAVSWLTRGVVGLQTMMQQKAGSPAGQPVTATWPAPRHPTMSPQLDPMLTYLLHGTKPEFLASVMYNGMRAGAAKNNMYGAGVYLADMVDKIDQYTTGDCTLTSKGTCDYVIEQFDEKFVADSTAPIFYGVVVLTSPFRVVERICAQDGNTANSTGSNQFHWFYNSDREVFEEYVKKGDDYFLKNGAGAPMHVKYQSQRAVCNALHTGRVNEVLARAAATYPGAKGPWRPCLARMDEYVIHDAGHTRVDYIVAYQRECKNGKGCNIGDTQKPDPSMAHATPAKSKPTVALPKSAAPPKSSLGSWSLLVSALLSGLGAHGK